MKEMAIVIRDLTEAATLLDEKNLGIYLLEGYKECSSQTCNCDGSKSGEKTKT
jgi:hypothetical protein